MFVPNLQNINLSLFTGFPVRGVKRFLGAGGEGGSVCMWGRRRGAVELLSEQKVRAAKHKAKGR